MRVELTIRLAKSRINGFEGHEDHRTPFASVRIIAGQGRKPSRRAFFVKALRVPAFWPTASTTGTTRNETLATSEETNRLNPMPSLVFAARAAYDASLGLAAFAFL